MPLQCEEAESCSGKGSSTSGVCIYPVWQCILQVIPAEYAFVVHTANPITGAAGELFGEVVVGMGEALVGNLPGRALSFSASSSSKDAASTPAVQLLSLPSKRVGLFSDPAASNLIARSDSNGEDLEAFAGAGTHLLVGALLASIGTMRSSCQEQCGCIVNGPSSIWKDEGSW